MVSDSARGEQRCQTPALTGLPALTSFCQPGWQRHSGKGIEVGIRNNSLSCMVFYPLRSFGVLIAGGIFTHDQL
jgi:hypothetical protein